MKMHSMFGAKLYVFVFVLFAIGTDANLLRVARGAVSVGTIASEKVIPPLKLGYNEARAPDPGWTHCIKNLKANTFWRTLGSNNLFKNEQPTHTQFQCSWFIESSEKKAKVRVSFEKVKLASSAQCTETFLEIIDTALGKSQGRFCGGKHIPDYVSSGHRLRIDIHGKEDLVNAIEEGEKPFIISYRTTTGSPGYRINAPSPSKYDKTHISTIDAKDFTPNTPSKVVRVSVGDTVNPAHGPNTYSNTAWKPISSWPAQDNDVTYHDGHGSDLPLEIWHIVLIVLAGVLVMLIIIFIIFRIRRNKKGDDKKLEPSDAEKSSSEESATWKSPTEADKDELNLISEISYKAPKERVASTVRPMPSMIPPSKLHHHNNNNAQSKHSKDKEENKEEIFKPKPTQHYKKVPPRPRPPVQRKDKSGVKGSKTLRTISRLGRSPKSPAHPRRRSGNVKSSANEKSSKTHKSSANKPREQGGKSVSRAAKHNKSSKPHPTRSSKSTNAAKPTPSSRASKPSHGKSKSDTESNKHKRSPKTRDDKIRTSSHHTKVDKHSRSKPKPKNRNAKTEHRRKAT